MSKTTYQDLIRQNREWVSAQLEIDPLYFENLSKGQDPSFLCIGCSDSRLPINVLTQAGPGELFVHRNIANQVSLSDTNVLSVLEYGVEALKVGHIIVCGHQGCGGIEAAISGDSAGSIKSWVSPIRDIYLAHRDEIDRMGSIRQKTDYLAELNVIAQVKNICQTSALKKAFQNGLNPQLHGWMFHMTSGEIHNLDLPVEDWKAEGILPKGD